MKLNNLRKCITSEENVLHLIQISYYLPNAYVNWTVFTLKLNTKMGCFIF